MSENELLPNGELRLSRKRTRGSDNEGPELSESSEDLDYDPGETMDSEDDSHINPQMGSGDEVNPLFLEDADLATASQDSQPTIQTIEFPIAPGATDDEIRDAVKENLAARNLIAISEALKIAQEEEASQELAAQRLATIEEAAGVDTEEEEEEMSLEAMAKEMVGRLHSFVDEQDKKKSKKVNHVMLMIEAIIFLESLPLERNKFLTRLHHRMRDQFHVPQVAPPEFWDAFLPLIVGSRAR